VAENKSGYQVLGRKYRPKDFSEMKGQDALVRTLSNAINSGRVAQAFMLTGVRGIGKTSTARILARALNCEKGPTVTPCGVCEQCRAITEDRSMDVLEMDAASKNGVDDIRDIIDSVQYAPVSGRYKVFILNEVHMLSKAAFNALLKTLEEPPAHVKFVFATTEIRKVPVTVLSRCQRFDLKRVDAVVLNEFFKEILQKEGRTAEDGAVALIARAADGSVRDGLSLLDQAISYEPDLITEAHVRAMLGLVDRSITMDLFEAVMKGESTKALALLDSLYKNGADSLMVLQDLIDLTHYVTKIKVAPDLAKDIALPEAERIRGLDLSKQLPIPVLTRTWQMLLKGLPEVQYTPNPQLSLEMLIIRLLYVSDQPTPGDLLKKLQDGSSISAAAPRGGNLPRGGGSTAISAMPVTNAFSEVEAVAQVNGFRDVVALFGQKREVILQTQIKNNVHLVSFKPGHLEIRLKAGAPSDIPGKMKKNLDAWTGERWMISISREEGEATIADQEKAQENKFMDEIKTNPIVGEIFSTFPGAKIIEIKSKGK